MMHLAHIGVSVSIADDDLGYQRELLRSKTGGDKGKLLMHRFRNSEIVFKEGIGWKSDLPLDFCNDSVVA